MALFDSIFSGSSGITTSLLNMFGITSYYIKSADSTYDPRTDTTGNTTNVETSCVTSPLLSYTTYEMKDSNIQKGDCKLLGNAIDFPDIKNTKDKIRVNNITFIIVSHDIVSTGEQNALIKLQLRKVV